VELKRAADFLLCVVVAAVLVGVAGDGEAAQPWQAIGMVTALFLGGAWAALERRDA
jgi:drug/metabolite transporter (DMT)-like permease